MGIGCDYYDGQADGKLTLGENSSLHIGTPSQLANLTIGFNDGDDNATRGTGVLDALQGQADLHLNQLNVGYNDGPYGKATGTFTTGDGSRISADVVNIGRGPNATGTVNLTGGLLTADRITVGSGGDFNFTGGRLGVNHFVTYASDNTLLQEGGTLAPGFSRTVRSLPGITECEANYIINTSGVLEIELFGTIAGTEYDQLQVAGDVNLDGDDQGGGRLDLILQFAPSVGDTFVIVENDGIDPVAGHFWGLPEATQFTEWYMGTQYEFWISYRGLTGKDNDVVLWTREIAPPDYVPVPGAVLLAGIGVGIVGRLRRRRLI